VSGSSAKDGLARNATLHIKASANVPFRSMFLMNRSFHPLLGGEGAFRQPAMHAFHLRQLGRGGSGENASCSSAAAASDFLALEMAG
jgi:hypothetical protein